MILFAFKVKEKGYAYIYAPISVPILVIYF